MKLLAPLLCTMLFLLACNNEKNSQQTESNATDSLGAANDAPPKPAKLTVNIDNFRLRDRPGLEAKEIARLAMGTVVWDVGEVSDFTTRIKLRGVQFDEPWLKVRTAEGLEGWVYGGGLNFELDKKDGLSKLLINKRLQTIFGKNVADDINRYRTNFMAAQTSQQIAQTYQEGLRLRDTLAYLLEGSIPVENYDELPDLFWLKQAIPGYVPQLVAEGTVYYLFNDYKRWTNRAATTEGNEDDAFMTLCLEIFSSDSVEYFYPSWFIQTWDYGGHSLLGQGIHHNIIAKMDQLYKDKSPFTEQLLDLKQQWLNDIAGEGTSYWEGQPKIVQELKAIIEGDYSILNRDDMIALKTRLKMLQNPKANNIEINHRSGMVQ